VFEVFQPK